MQNTLMKSNINIAIGGNEVKQALTTKSLGVIIDKNNLVLMLSKPNTNPMKRSFSYAAAKIWNSQDARIRKEVLDQ